MQRPWSSATGRGIFNSNHQKHVTMYNSKSKVATAFFGGIDIAAGRYDDERKIVLHSELSQANSTEFDSHLYHGYLSQHPSVAEWRKKPQGKPRMPWQDVQCSCEGSPALQIAQVFFYFWQKGGGKSALAYPKPVGGPSATTNTFQLLHHAVGDRAESRMIQEGMIRVIQQARSFVYIEQQFFQGRFDPNVCPKGKCPLTNRIPDAIIEALKKNSKLYIYVVLPLLPDTGVDSSATNGILYYQYYTFCYIRSQLSLVGATNRFLVMYIARRDTPGGNKNKSLADDHPIYVHSKMLIADDQVALVGSANVNDRSLAGDLDTELAAIIHSPPAVKQLRESLWCEHSDKPNLVNSPLQHPSSPALLVYSLFRMWSLPAASVSALQRVP